MARLVPALGVGALAYVILLAYGVARPVTDSLFIATYGSRWLPAAWVGVAVAVVPAVALYNRFASRVQLTTLLLGGSAASAALLAALAAARQAQLPGSTYVLYVWKDVHVVVLLEILWSLANVVFRIQTARWAYGGFLVAGSLGGITGNLIVERTTEALGSGGVLWLALPAYALVAVLAPGVGALAGRPHPPERERPRSTVRQSWEVLRGSRYLAWLVLLICLVQLTITLIDYQYSVAVEAAFTDTDAQTRAMSKVDAAINFGSLALQLLTGPVLRLLAVPLTLLAIPLLLGGAVAGFVAVPRFAVMAFGKATSKILDYSLFRAAKEILYIPLDYEEKTQGKAVIDMLVYRVAKAGVSALLLGLLAVEAATARHVVSVALFVLIGSWIAVTLRIVRRYRRIVSRERELRGAA